MRHNVYGRAPLISLGRRQKVDRLSGCLIARLKRVVDGR